jgi:uncharacterized protein YjbI with pentapeptide repeats
VRFIGAHLTDANLRRANLTRAVLRDAHLTGADLSRANLTGTNLRDAHLTDAELTEAILDGADLTMRNGPGIGPLRRAGRKTSARPTQPWPCRW